MTFRQTRIVEFQHCDPAGIVFYPRYFEMVSSVIERFFTDALGFGFGANMKRGIGVPTARIAVDFHAPSRLEDSLDFALVVTRIGNSSADYRLICTCHQPRFTATGTLVHYDFTAGRSAPWPDDLRAGLARHLATEPA
ncbi:acyl-CoA thioesterase [Falsirhodobacter xinxiangensis]|uniref:acyl-CoA thioesterase n=1 Tax=Falsirhodobacter xinxiangensis TaxID=2530049 RepID=UPI0010A99B76|nr:thioesterase family protein [Rhodobacter xinxiangensis]